MHLIRVLVLTFSLTCTSNLQAQDLGDLFKDVLREYAEQKAEEAGIDLTGGRAKNVNLVFTGATTPAPDVFSALYTVEEEENPIPVPEPNPTTPTTASLSPEQDCFNRVQGRIAWNYEGNKSWSAGNIKRLCKGTRIGAAPATCFYNTMFRTHLWGKKPQHTMNWSLASQLCAGTNNATRPTSCLKGQLARNLSLKNAVNVCDLDPKTKPSVVASAPKLQEGECYEYVQGRIAWDAKRKNKNWNPSNVKRLCKGTTSKYSPGNCFSYAMHSGAKWGKRSSHVMNWQKAIELCGGTSNAKAVTTCFKNSISAGRNLDSSIARCKNY